MELDLSKIKKVFFLGVGGIGVSAIAKMMLLQGKAVLGSDIGEGEAVRLLRESGAEIFQGQDISFIPEDVDLVVYTIAVPIYAPDFFESVKNKFKVPILSYPEILGEITKEKYTIAVSGTHGKTTTTAMIAKILIDAGLDPSVVVGSFLKEYKSNLVAGKSEYFAVEACEYERSFLNIHPKVLVITNIEADHLDYYKDLDDIQDAFSDMVLQTRDVVVCDPDDSAVMKVLQDKNIEIIDFKKYLGKVPKLLVPGEHNRKDAACALAVASILGIEEGEAQKYVASFAGTWRRLDKQGVSTSGTVVYDDYAHHPTEIKASLSGLREFYPKSSKKVTVLFQPHLYSRTKAFFDEFATCFEDADEVLLLPIYFAREKPDPEVSSEKLALAIGGNGVKARAFASFEEAEGELKKLNFGENDIFVSMGAGEAYKVLPEIFDFREE